MLAQSLKRMGNVKSVVAASKPDCGPFSQACAWAMSFSFSPPTCSAWNSFGLCDLFQIVWGNDGSFCRIQSGSSTSAFWTIVGHSLLAHFFSSRSSFSSLSIFRFLLRISALNVPPVLRDPPPRTSVFFTSWLACDLAPSAPT